MIQFFLADGLTNGLTKVFHEALADLKSDQEYLSMMDGCFYCIPNINFPPFLDLSLGLLLPIPCAKTDEGCCKNSKNLFKLLTAE